MKRIYRIIIVILLALSLSACQKTDSNIKESSKQRYNVYNDSFTYIGFKKKSLNSYNFKTNIETSTPIIVVSAKSNINLVEVTANTTMYSQDEKKIHNTTKTITKSIIRNQEFNIDFEISKKVSNETTRVSVTFSGKTTDKNNNSKSDKKIEYKVLFKFNNGEIDLEKKVKANETISKPSTPHKKNYIFQSWYLDQDFKHEYDFSKKITSDLNLYAKYIVDYATITNKVTHEIMPSVVNITKKNYNTILGITTSSQSFIGSGIIFYEGSGYYYALTNNHVTVKNPDYSKVSYEVEDYKGNKYDAYLKHESPSYDLAVIYFKKKETLKVIDRAKENPNIDTEIISLGQPKGQTNAITYGKVTEYTEAPILKNTKWYESSVQFEVISHSARIAGGSSGGAILDVDFNLVGINYASSTSYNSGEFVSAYAIPIKKVEEYLRVYIWS
ncbi:predicted serine protease [Alteracholeplasma palmae J233]|uniref:Predicted serine protease n=1 Tax=Alteracholeplasma palmae (strain ATCC 49389 / J233) TaxID=1318466 RepID=U4KJJ4_ALTPJ|nr:trypsin-like peptidase domain-containing protein [Alteracholeplasma palmae]CCV63619.1 predicted serine protease [Alteracholeplasma palmae J233]